MTLLHAEVLPGFGIADGGGDPRAEDGHGGDDACSRADYGGEDGDGEDGENRAPAPSMMQTQHAPARHVAEAALFRDGWR